MDLNPRDMIPINHKKREIMNIKIVLITMLITLLTACGTPEFWAQMQKTACELNNRNAC